MQNLKPLHDIEPENPANHDLDQHNKDISQLDSKGSAEAKTAQQTHAEQNQSSDYSQKPVHSPDQIYPEPKTVQEREESRQIAKNEISNTGATPLLALIVAILGSVAGVYSLYQVLKLYFISGLIGGNVLSFILAPSDKGSFSYWIIFLVLLAQSGAIIYSSYKVWQGRIAGLAFLTGVSFTTFYSYIFSVEIIFSNLDIIAEIDFDYLLLFVLYSLFFISLVLCWARSRSYFK